MSKTVEYKPDLVPSQKKVSNSEQLATRIGENVNVSAVFAQPIERDGVTVIPVARILWGVGDSRIGTSPQAVKEGTQEVVGKGVGASISPIGYIELKDGKASFKPIFGFATILWMQFVGGVLTLMILRRFDEILRHRQLKGRQRISGHTPGFNVVASPGTNIVLTSRGRRRLKRTQQGRSLFTRKAKAEPHRPVITKSSKPH